MPDDSGRLDVITLVARRLGGESPERLTGGVTVSAWLPYPSYGGLPPMYRRPGSASPPIYRRLRPGWTEAQFLRAAEGVYARAREAARLQLRRENVADAFKPYEGDAMAQAVRAMARKGHYRIYEMITVEDCAFWLKWLTKWRARRRDADAGTTR